ncbi:MAG: AraC family transcriptional regulator [Lachnospiraceae bacterium]|nr:AraC family transcriptional regulator [Lachnospiraceae bacterium]MDY4970998.1 AraC family transcriptional regulator [Lachnospiraceae bacterium]
MNLSEQCRQITGSDCRQLAPDHQLSSRLVCPEYSKSVKEVKVYPLLSSERIFFLCWNFDGLGLLRAAMYPSPEKFCYPFHFKNGDKTQRHTHDYIELGYVVQGSFRQRICEKDIVFQEGDFCLIDKNCIHQDYLMDQPSTVLFFGIDNEMFREITDENVSTEKIISFLQTALMKQKDLQQYIHFRPAAGAREKMESCISLLLSELYEPQIGSSYLCKGLLLRIFRLLSTDYEFSLSRKQQKTMSWIVFEEVCSYIQSHYQTVTIQDLMEIFHFQEDYFNRLIKKKTGLTYSAYVQDIRLKKAEQLLLHTERSVSDIAEQVGYQNKGYFYKIFSEKYGMTPARYREAQKV